MTTPTEPQAGARTQHTPEQVLNNAVDYIRSLKTTGPGYADKVQAAVDEIKSQRDAFRVFAHQNLERLSYYQKNESASPETKAQRDELRVLIGNLIDKLETFEGCNQHDMNGPEQWPEFAEAYAAIASAEGRAQ